jgi:hypothetical protein
VSPTTTHFTNHYWTRMNPKAHGKLHTFLSLQTLIERRRDDLDNAQTCKQGAPRIVFVRHWPAKIDQQPVTEILGNMAFILVNDLGGCLLIGPDHLTQVFGVELL